jgi:transcriptional regulator of nitric oxide reductase
MRRSHLLGPFVIDFLLGLLAGLALCLPASAGELSRAQVERRFPPPLHVQEKLAELAAWPLTSELEPEAGPVGYVFESIDLAPLPGFEGTPFNLLIAIDRKGNFLDVEVLRQHEPVFLGGLGEPPLREFVKQYAGKNIAQTITISSSYSGARNQQSGGGNLVVLDGVTKATASIRIVNQTVLAAALAVARARLGFAAPGQHGPPAKARGELFERYDFAELLRRGMVQRLVVSNAAAEKLFAGSDGEGADEEGLAHPQDALVELYVAYLNPPSIGRSLLGDGQWTALRSMLHGKLEEGQHLLWIATAGRYSMLDERFVPGSPPQRLALRQDRLNLELRDFDFELTAPAGAPPLNASRLYTVYAEAGLDPGRPFAIDLTLIRAKGMMLPRITRQNVSLDYATPAALLVYPPSPPPCTACPPACARRKYRVSGSKVPAAVSPICATSCSPPCCWPRCCGRRWPKSWSRPNRSRPPSPSASTAPGPTSPTPCSCCWPAPATTSCSAACSARSAPPSPSAASCAAGTGCRAAPNAASPARPAAAAATTTPSSATAPSATTTASSASIASASTTTSSAARRCCCGTRRGAVSVQTQAAKRPRNRAAGRRRGCCRSIP